MTFVQKNIAKTSRVVDAGSLLDLVNRSLKLLGDRTLSEALLGVTFIEMWVVLISFVLWSVSPSDSQMAWHSKSVLLLSLLATLVTGMLAGYVWLLEKSGQKKPAIKKDDW